jgi:ribulose-phosphate 3-epimerase
MNKVIIAPSLLAADFRNLEREFEKINSSEAEWIHFDVMDGQNVPNISFGFPLLEATRKLTDKYIDVHLMIENPSKYFEEFKKYGADGLTIHFEKNPHVSDDLKKISSLGLKAGLVINPDTNVEVITPYLAQLDLVLIMSVYPGFGGQKFIEATYDRVNETRKLIEDSGRCIILQVDGGVSIDNSQALIEAGADALVCGSALFKEDNFEGYVLKLQDNI